MAASPAEADRLKRWRFGFIASLPCIACALGPPSQVAHVRISDAQLGKFNAMAKKPDDFVLPLCWRCHSLQHQGEVSYWAALGIDPLDYAFRLHGVSGDARAGTAIIAEAWKFIWQHRRTTA